MDGWDDITDRAYNAYQVAGRVRDAYDGRSAYRYTLAVGVREAFDAIALAATAAEGPDLATRKLALRGMVDRMQAALVTLEALSGPPRLAASEAQDHLTARLRAGPTLDLATTPGGGRKPTRVAPVDLTERTERGWTRTAIRLAPGGALASVDIVRSDGSLLARINAGAWQDGGGTVDTIIGPGQRGTFLAWLDGQAQGQAQVRQETAPGTTVHAVAIRPEAP
jgi:hypothetical protein